MNAILEQINSAGEAFVDFALPMLTQSGILILILLLIDFLLRRKVRAVFRYWIWMLVLAKLVLPTSLASPLSLGYLFGDRLTSLQVVPTSPQTVEQSPIVTTPIIDLSNIPTGKHTTPTMPTRPSDEPILSKPLTSSPVSPVPISWQGVVFLLWLSIVIAMGLLLLQRAIFVKGLVAQAGEADDSIKDTFNACCERMSIRKRISLGVSANATSPAVCGLFRPVILLPNNLSAGLSAGQLQSVLLHELAHIKRGDLWMNLVQTILQIVYFYNPLLWFANAIIRRIREQAVDEMVLVAMGENAQQYPETLVSVAKLTFKQPVLSLRLIGVVESKSALASRIKRILNRPIPKTTKLGIVGIFAVIVIAAILLPMAKAARKAPLGISDILNISDASGQLTIKSISMPPPEGKGILKKNFAELSVEVENSSEQDLYLGLEYYEDAGMVALFSPGAVQRAYIRRVPKNWTGRLDFQIQYIRFVSGGNLQLKLAKCPPPESYYPQGNLVFLPVNGTEIIFEKKYVLVPNDKDKQTATQGGSSAQSKFVATLSNGVTVELVGVCEFIQGKVQKWWKPDGTMLEKPIYTNNGPDYKNTALGFMVRTDKSVSLIKWDIEGAIEHLGSLPIVDSNNQLTESYRKQEERIHLIKISDRPKTEIMLTVAPAWDRTIRYDGKYVIGRNDPKIKFIETYETAEGVKVVFQNDYEGYENDLQAVLSNEAADRLWQVVQQGKRDKFRISAKFSTVYSDGQKQTSAFFEKLKRRDVRYFEFFTRPFPTKVTFKNVSLRPGVKTDVRVDVLRLGAVKGEQERPANGIRAVPEITKTGKSIIQIDLMTGEVVSGRQMDWETAVELKNILGDKVALDDPAPPSKKSALAAGALLRKAVAATDVVEGASGRNKRVTKEELKAVVDTLASRGYLKILTNPTLQVVSGKTAKVKSAKASSTSTTEDSFEVTARVLDDGYIELQTRVVLDEKSTPADQDNLLLVTKRELSGTFRIGSGASCIAGGIEKSVKRPVVGDNPETLEYRTTEELVVLTATVIDAPSSPQPRADVQVEVEQKKEEREQLQEQAVIRAVDNKATLASGLSIELLGVTRVPVRDQPWWKPDGSPLEPMFEWAGFDPSLDPDWEQFDYYAVVIRLTDMPSDKIGWMDWRFSDANGYPISADFYPSPERVSNKYMVAKAARFSNGVETTTLHIGIVSGEWQTLFAGSHYGIYEKGGNSVYVGTAEKGGGPGFVGPDEKGIHISVTYNITDRDFRVVAVDKEGKVYVSSRSGSGGGKNLRRTTASFPDLTPQQLQEYRFQVRPYEWIEFKDIPLRPGREAVALAEQRKARRQEELEKWLGEGQTRQIREQIAVFRDTYDIHEPDNSQVSGILAMQELVRIGSPAVPELVAELRRCERRLTKSLIAFTLRTIGDRQVVPALIELLGQSKYSGELGIYVKDDRLANFMLDNQYRPPDEGDRKAKAVIIGCPVMEITAALEKITGHSEGHEHFGHKATAELGRDATHEQWQQRVQQVVQETAERWQKWWEQQRSKTAPS